MSSKVASLLTNDSLTLCADVSSVRQFTHVVVATGHFSYPHLPEERYEGLATFPGRLLHSRDFSDARHFAQQNVVIVGAK